jgi:hypothetical protein
VEKRAGYSALLAYVVPPVGTAFATQPRYVLSYRCTAGDLVIWSNLATVHRAAGYDDLKYPRNMRRTTIRAPGFGEEDEGNYLKMYGSSLDMLGR